MPLQLKQTAAIQAAQDLQALAALAKQLRDQGAAFVTRYNSENYSATWGAMPTAPQNADGTLGAQDGSPVAANPINGFGIFKSKNQLVAMVTCLNQLANFFGNVAVVQGNYSQSVDDLAS